jgi:hypothetical protein
MRRAMGASEARSPAGTKAAPPPLRLPAAAGSSGGVEDSQCASREDRVTGSVKKMLRWAGFLGVGPPSVGSEWAWAPEIRILANWSHVHSTCVLMATATY